MSAAADNEVDACRISRFQCHSHMRQKFTKGVSEYNSGSCPKGDRGGLKRLELLRTEITETCKPLMQVSYLNDTLSRPFNIAMTSEKSKMVITPFRDATAAVV
jgi:hypothetical protein